MHYPIEAIQDEVIAACNAHRSLIVSAPPASGKTTVLPLALMQAPFLAGKKILMLEPRRVACVAAAWRLAAQLNEKPGGSVGYRTRLDSVNGARIEVVTEGVLTRMIQHDPLLDSIGMVIFDEFHERNLAAELGLALTLDIQGAMREDLRILVMSATLDTAALAQLLDGAPVIQGSGALHEVKTYYRPDDRQPPLEKMTADCVRYALERETGGILVFLPGEGEIKRTADLLRDLSGDVHLYPLYGRLAPAEQLQAIAPAPPGTRKIVLATNIAESSLTIDGVRIVIDSGLERRAIYSPGTGMNHLTIGMIAAANADQRRGRAGRMEPGVCFRLWSKNTQERLPAFALPEIAQADLSSFALELAAWGVRSPEELRFLEMPPEANWQAARQLLRELAAIDDDGQLTDHGKQLHRTGLHPRIAEIVVMGIARGAGMTACRLAAILTEFERSAPGGELDLELLVAQAHHGRVGELARQLAQRFKVRGGDDPAWAPGLLAQAFPDRIARRRSGTPGEKRYLLASGRGAYFRDDAPLSRQELLVIPALKGGAAESEVQLACALKMPDVERWFGDRIVASFEVESEAGRFRWRERRKLGAVVLTDTPSKAPDLESVRQAVAVYIRANGLAVLPWSPAALRLRERLLFLQRCDGSGEWPDWSDEALLAELELWLLPMIFDRADPLGKVDLLAALRATLDYATLQELEKLAPEHFTTPLGSRLVVDYAGDTPTLSVKLTEMYGVKVHPTVGKKHLPLTLQLLSPAQRPVQITSDLPGFWRGTYSLVRAEMKSRYPKHFWPEDPANSPPTRQTRARMEGQ